MKKDATNYRIIVERNIPIPAPIHKPAKAKKPKRISLLEHIKALKIGECVKALGYTTTGVSVAAATARKATGNTYVMRKVEEHGKTFCRVWRVEPAPKVEGGKE